jgi:hypothetical protein
MGGLYGRDWRRQREKMGDGVYEFDGCYKKQMLGPTLVSFGTSQFAKSTLFLLPKSF